MTQDIAICLRILGYSTFKRFGIFGIFGIFNSETLGDDSGHCNMPKDIGIFNFQEIREIRDIRDIQDIQLRDIGG